MEPLAMFIRDGSHVFRKKKIQMEKQKMKFQYPIALYDEISSCTMSLLFSTFS
jgi:hypothetical protein